MCPREDRERELGLYRYAVGGAYLALTGMLFYGVSRYVDLIVPRFGNRFSYVAALMVGVACWMGVRGVLILLGKRGGRRR